MLDKRRLIFLLGLSGLAIVSLVNVCAARLRTRDERGHRKALQRWEGEGGNVTSPAQNEVLSDTLSQDATP